MTATAPILQASDWAFIAENAEFIIDGLVVTILLTLSSITLGFLIGFPAGAIEVYGSGPLKWAVETAGVVIRGIPIVVILVYIFFVLSLSNDPFWAATIGLGLRGGAYQSQIFRGAFQSVSTGQMEAARSIGLSRLQAIRHVIVPQALRRSVPGFQNEFTIVLKDTSVALVVGLSEMLTRGRDLYLQPEGGSAVLEVFLTISAIYFVLTFVTNRSLDKLNDYYAIPGGNSR
ncbi:MULTISPECIES: amino acid ABC transporter permease [unclassified Haladaptatus]|uniref:amino acid ABC transporter permease n=1 Tax=unclassified Haladaptatus TaxID=2622732 RepID=UPI0023E81256|nr:MULTISPECIES: amino acid ABC transporter permease [unclassified Haladaptatus]